MGRSPMGGGGAAGGGGGPMMMGGRVGFFRTLGRAAPGAAGAGSGSGLYQPCSSSSNTITTPTSPTAAEKSNSSCPLSLSYDPYSPFTGLPITYPYLSPFSQQYDDFEFVSGDESSEADGSCDDYVFGPVPSFDEVQHVVSDLKRISPVGSELDWKEPSLHLCNPRTLQPCGSDRIYDAFHLLRTEPSVQRMVISLSSDKAVWDAVLKNEVVQELRQTYQAAGGNSLPDSDKNSNNSNAAADFLRWILTKAKVFDVIDKITKLVNQIFSASNNERSEGTTTATTVQGRFDTLLQNVYMLTVLVMLAVVANRIKP